MSYNAKFNKNGNIKIGQLWSFNKLAGSGKIKGCKGSCDPKYCTGCYNKENPRKSACYVFKSYSIYPSVVDSHVRNTTAMRKNMIKSFEELDTQIKRAKKKPSGIRIHASGELETAMEIINWNALALKYPDIPFYLYTKAYDLLDEVLPVMTLAPNFYINISVWHDVGVKCYNKYKHIDNVRAFVYDDGYKYPKSLKFDCHCPAYDSKGKMNHDITCDKCKICFSNKAKVCACYDH